MPPQAARPSVPRLPVPGCGQRPASGSWANPAGEAEPAGPATVRLPGAARRRASAIDGLARESAQQARPAVSPGASREVAGAGAAALTRHSRPLVRIARVHRQVSGRILAQVLLRAQASGRARDGLVSVPTTCPPGGVFIGGEGGGAAAAAARVPARRAGTSGCRLFGWSGSTPRLPAPWKGRGGRALLGRFQRQARQAVQPAGEGGHQAAGVTA